MLRSFIRFAAALALLALFVLVGLWSGPRWLGIDAVKLDRALWVRSERPVESRLEYALAQLQWNAHALSWHVFPPRRITGRVSAVAHFPATDRAPRIDPSEFEVVLRAAFDEPPEGDRWSRVHYPARDELVVVERTRVQGDGTYSVRRPRGAVLLDIAVEGKFVTDGGVVADEHDEEHHSYSRFVVGSSEDPGWKPLHLGASRAGALTVRCVSEGPDPESLQGKVLCLSGLPFGIRFSSFSGISRRATIDADGWAHFHGLVPGTWQFEPDLEGTGPPLFVRGPLEVFVSEDEEVDVDVPLSSASTLSGRLVDMEGRAVTGAEVWQTCLEARPPFRARHVKAQTDAAGRFALSVPRDAALSHLSCLPETAERSVNFFPDELVHFHAAEEVELEMGPAEPARARTQVDVRVTGVPVAEQRVEVELSHALPGTPPSWNRGHFVHSSESPGWEFTGALEAGRYRARAVLIAAHGRDGFECLPRRLSGSVEFEVPTARGATAVSVDIGIPALSDVEIVVRTADGAVLPGSPVSIRYDLADSDPSREPVVSRRADERGVVLLTSMVPGRYRATVSSDERSGTAAFEVHEGDAPFVEILAVERARVDVVGAHVIRFWRLDASGAEAAARLEARPGDVDQLSKWGLPASDGTARSFHVAPGRYVVEALMEENLVAEELIARRTVDLGPGETLRWKVERGTPKSRFTGVVRSGGLPVSKVRVELRDPLGVVSSRAIDATGRFELPGYTDGPWTLDVRAETGEFRSRGPVVYVAPLAAKPGKHDVGTIDLPAASVHVYVRASEGGVPLEMVGPEGEVREPVTDGSTSHFAFLDPGSYTVRAVAHDGTPHPAFSPVPVEVVEGAPPVWLALDRD